MRGTQSQMPEKDPKPQVPVPPQASELAGFGESTPAAMSGEPRSK